jgi:hypothetical protein
MQSRLILGQAHHAFLVDGVAVGVAVLEHLPHPLQLEQRAVRADRQRRVALEQPLDGLQRDAGRGPGRGVAGRDLAGVGEAGFQRRPRLAVDHGDVVAAARQIIRGRDADHTAAQHDYSHSVLKKIDWMMQKILLSYI